MNTLTLFAFAPNRCSIEEAAKQDSAQKVAIVIVLAIVVFTVYITFGTGKEKTAGNIILMLSIGTVISIVVYYIIGLFFAPWCI